MVWFEKKVALEVPRQDGTLRHVKVPQSKWDRWVREGKVRRVEEQPPKERPTTECEAAAFAVLTAKENARGAWPTLMTNFREMPCRPLQLRDEIRALRDFSVAIVAFELGAVANLFPADQASRLVQWTLRVGQRVFGDGAPQEMAAYDAVVQHALDHPEAGELPHDALWWRLLEQWLGSSLRTHEVVFEGKPTGFLDPLLPMVLSDVVMRPPFLRTWKELSEGPRLREGA